MSDDTSDIANIANTRDTLKAIPTKELVCVLFPGVVKNDDKALECLGGLRNISEAYSQSSKERLGLSFQPNNRYVKKAFADIKKTSGILFKIKVKKTITGTEVKKEIISTSIMGQVKQCYHFNSMSDFQYLPVNTNMQPPQCVLENILPSGLDTFEHFINIPVDPFIVPTSFTRTDKPFVYAYTDKKDEKATNEDEEFHYRLRDRKAPFAPFIFNMVDEWPSGPKQYFLDQFSKSDEELKREYEIIKGLFDERPIWSRNALMFKTKIKPSSMKIILPCIGVNPKIGPWKLVWIKYGYDPRIEPEARIYQSLDFRVRQDGGLKCMVLPRDSTAYYKKVNHVKTNVAATGNIPEGAVFFRPGMVPPQRQIYYQYCDIELPDVQEMISVKPTPGTLCHHSRGWLASGVADKCRDLLYEYTRKAILATNTTVVYEGGSSSDEEDDASTSVN